MQIIDSEIVPWGKGEKVSKWNGVEKVLKFLVYRQLNLGY